METGSVLMVIVEEGRVQKRLLSSNKDQLESTANVIYNFAAFPYVFQIKYFKNVARPQQAWFQPEQFSSVF